MWFQYLRLGNTGNLTKALGSIILSYTRSTVSTCHLRQPSVWISFGDLHRWCLCHPPALNLLTSGRLHCFYHISTNLAQGEDRGSLQVCVYHQLPEQQTVCKTLHYRLRGYGSRVNDGNHRLPSWTSYISTPLRQRKWLTTTLGATLHLGEQPKFGHCSRVGVQISGCPSQPKLHWIPHSTLLYRHGQFLLRSPRSFRVCSTLLRTFFWHCDDALVFYAAVCWEGWCTKKDSVYRLVRTASMVLDCPLDLTQEVVRGEYWQSWNPSWTTPFTTMTMTALSSSSSSRLLYPLCRKEGSLWSFIPTASRQYNTSMVYTLSLSHTQSAIYNSSVYYLNHTSIL